MKTKVSDLTIGDKLVIDGTEYLFKRWVRKRLRRIGLTDFREMVCTSDKKKIQLLSCNLDDVPVVLQEDFYIYKGS